MCAQENYYCIDGIRFSCPTVVCWPLVVSAYAADGPPYTQGLSTGDTITVTFNKPTNMIDLSNSVRVYNLFNFSAYIGELNASVPPCILRTLLEWVYYRKVCMLLFCVQDMARRFHGEDHHHQLHVRG